MAAQQACGGLLEGSSNKNKEKEITLSQFHGPNQCLERNKTGNVAQEVWCGVEYGEGMTTWPDFPLGDQVGRQQEEQAWRVELDQCGTCQVI